MTTSFPCVRDYVRARFSFRFDPIELVDKNLSSTSWVSSSSLLFSSDQYSIAPTNRLSVIRRGLPLISGAIEWVKVKVGVTHFVSQKFHRTFGTTRKTANATLWSLNGTKVFFLLGGRQEPQVARVEPARRDQASQVANAHYGQAKLGGYFTLCVCLFQLLCCAT